MGVEDSNRRTGGPWPGGLAPELVTDAVAAPDSGTHFRAVGFAVSSLGYATARRFRAALASVQMEPREFAVLQAVDAAKGLTQQAIGDRLQIPPSRMVSVVDALEGRSLLERRHNPDDRRTRELYLTTAGGEVLERALTVVAGLEADLCAQLSAPQRAQLLSLLDRVGVQLGLPRGADAVHAHPALAEE